MSNRNSIIGFILIFAILIGYYLITSPSKEELAERQRKQDSVLAVKRLQDSLALVKQIQEARQEAPRDTVKQAVASREAPDEYEEYEERLDKYGIFARAAEGEPEVLFIENELIKLGFSTKGGKVVYVELKDYKTWDGYPLLLLDSDTNEFGFTFFANNRTIHTKDFYFQPHWDNSANAQEVNSVSGKGELTFKMRLYASADTSFDRDRYIEYVYTLRGKDYMVGFDVNFHNIGNTIDATRGYIDFEWAIDMRKQERTVDRLNGATIYYKPMDDKVTYLSEMKDDSKSLKERIKWVSFKQSFFTSVLISDNYFVDPVMEVSTLEGHPDERYLRSSSAKIAVPYEGSLEEKLAMSFYYGPNKYNVLRKYKLDLERQIPLGWSFFLMQWINRYAVIPVFNFLGSLGWNYGIVILVLTILLKIVLFPIAYKTYMSSARMRVLKPEVDEINSKFPKKEDAMKKQQAVMAMYKKAGVNPMSGCIPVLLQMPILIAMFRFFPASIELRQQSFLWAHDLSSYDSILDLPFSIPFYGDHVSLFTILMTAATIIYTYMNNQMMGTSSQQMPGMKTMMYIMPVMFLPLFNNYSSGLSYYYLLVNLITFLQMFIFRRFIDEEKIRKQIQEKKAKPVKKSSFQKRLEDAAKKRGYNPRR
jgi:YidC/Oxa1 family membrane protein insertase